MHGIDTSVPHFFSHVQGTHIVVTLEIVSEVLHVPRVAHPDYPSYEYHAPNPILGFVTMTDMLISSLNLILTRTNLTFNKTFTKAFLFLFILVSLLK